MTDEKRIELNKLIRLYSGKNPFIISLKNQLKNGKYLTRIEVGKKKLKVLSDKQYMAFERAYDPVEETKDVKEEIKEIK
jgi:hypothetical protein